jgi:vacuolar-type H+-ATPase subunit E/Vma4
MEIATEKILRKIIEEANGKAEKIIDEAKTKANTIIENQKKIAHEKAQKEIKELINKSKNEAKIIRGRVITEIKRKANWVTLDAKNQLIANVLKEVEKRLFNLQNSKQYLSILQSLIENAGLLLSGGELEIILNKKDNSKPIKLKEIEKRITKKTHKKTKLMISNQNTNKIGVIVKTKNGKIIIDNTFDSILDRNKKVLELKAAKILFS